jgi:hypothetical protein
MVTKKSTNIQFLEVQLKCEVLEKNDKIMCIMQISSQREYIRSLINIYKNNFPNRKYNIVLPGSIQ